MGLQVPLEVPAGVLPGNWQHLVETTLGEQGEAICIFTSHPGMGLCLLPMLWLEEEDSLLWCCSSQLVTVQSFPKSLLCGRVLICDIVPSSVLASCAGD